MYSYVIDLLNVQERLDDNMDWIKQHPVKVLCFIIAIGMGIGGIQYQVSANSEKVEKLEIWQHVEEKEGARVSAQLEIVIHELRVIKQDIRNMNK